MSKLNELFLKELHVVNLGIESFAEDLKAQGKKYAHVNWKPVAGGDKEAAANLRKLQNPAMQEKIKVANGEALRRILDARPVLIGMGIARDVIPKMTEDTILHAGPPITWDRMCGPQRGAVMGGLIYEGRANSLEEAEKLIESGAIRFEPCHMHSAVGPMAGVVTPSMPVWVVENKTFTNHAYCTMNEGLGKVLRFGACDKEVFDRLHWMADHLYPILKAALEKKGEIDLGLLIAQSLQMGDEAHNRNKAATSLLIRELIGSVMEIDAPNREKADAIAFLNGNDHTFLNLSMPAMKATMDPVFNIPYSTIVGTMCRNGTDFGIRIAGLGEDRWFTAQAEMVQGLYFPGFSEADAARDLGDSCITETAGIGGFSMAAAPAIVQFVGGKVADAVNYSLKMYEITQGESRIYKIPALDFRGSATGIDLMKVMETGIRPIINTGIAHKRYGVGQVGAGLVHPPEDCFKQALHACAKAWTE